MTRYFAVLKYMAKPNMNAINKEQQSSVLSKLAQAVILLKVPGSNLN